MSVPRRFKTLAIAVSLLALTGCATYRRISAAHQDPLSIGEHLKLAQSYEAQHLDADAQREVEIVLHRESRNTEALLVQGNLALNVPNLARAEASFQKVLKIDPANAGAQNNLAMVYLQQGNLAEAESLAQKAALSPALRPYAFETLAQIAEKRRQWKEADTRWEAALKSVPIDDTALRLALEISRKQAAAQRLSNSRIGQR